MELLNGIKNIIFDLGGVIINIDPDRTLEAFKQLDYPNFEMIREQLRREGLYRMIEHGEITPEQFINRMKMLGNNLTDNDIINAWNVMLIDIPAPRIELLKTLNKKYRLFLLSNTNAIHMEQINAQLKEVHGLDTLTPLFEKEFYSYQLQLSKPDPKIFQYVLRSQKLVPSETLFIDDTAMHITTAIKAGIQVKHLQKYETIDELFAPHED